ncbi:peptidoglycan DD-metalloendopeptidase family protein [Pseudomonas sichuanensis]|uniref:peptidoglycan DD-metalloendopeptidase family protein n=1 Tax=Pseudomonas sichuanensis TaxID=2213015 RepID=UPI00244B3CB9|nr:peptidoglycan DD-metalloendopeptidase family protein [Pseudomonas sichuanensis]MDH0729610.1 peptidoglycan DD-metalloendopeptidase family protein [Pseudomonas sichuanensis]MDH1582233.1 peptidoglycan DD-metalloendopeptidase family protein [Pseudomonas sichuanensis]MDH1591338.1 peptidoglycan DD-metalloendopeptidase family protein [Pseudomonas sichuanensis]MDH1596940.1 peptidoglycan DD-metalloendopeptidase family protein [Pseudomonas sichuanensis]
MGHTGIRQRKERSVLKLVVIALAMGTLLAGCSSTGSSGARVVDRNNAAPKRPAVTSGQYLVKPGDTLFSIAFRYGWDYKELAARNNIPPPYTIRPGQPIRFSSGAGGSTTVVTSGPSSSSKTTVTRRPVGTPPPPANNGKSATSASSSSSQTVAQVPAAERAVGGWTWPANGVLIGKFASNGSLNKGVDIAGDLGQPVFAAADGAVVYAGSGLRGYGELIIIKHSDTYVSAYGHNRRLLVREGQQVKAGQTIAEMGSTGTDRVKLHFEIRRQGKPVDPLQFLPRR